MVATIAVFTAPAAISLAHKAHQAQAAREATVGTLTPDEGAPSTPPSTEVSAHGASHDGDSDSGNDHADGHDGDSDHASGHDDGQDEHSSVEPAATEGLLVTPSGMSVAFALLGRTHPMVTHFPIAAFLLALFAEALFAATGSVAYRHSVRFLVWAAAVGAAIAAPLGWVFAATASTEPEWLLETHRWFGTTTAMAGLVALWLCERAERGDAGRAALRAALVVLALLVGATGYLGGSLLYGIDHLWPFS